MADELEVLEKQQLSAQRSLNDLTDQLTLADHLVYKKLSDGTAELWHGGAFPADAGRAGPCPVHPAVPAAEIDPEKRARICSRSFLRCTIPAWRRAAVWR